MSVLVPGLALLVLVAACAADESSGATTTGGVTAEVSTVPASSAPSSTAGPSSTIAATIATTAPTTTTTTSVAATTAPTDPTNPTGRATTTAPAPSEPGAIIDLADGVEAVELGRSLEDRPIVAYRNGPSDADVVVLAIGVIHGDEDDGRAIAERLLATTPPPDVALWVVPSMNPDGEAAQIRHNAAGVDLNRNFPVGWGPIEQPGHWQYSGPSAASEPETRAMLALADSVRPDLTLWYHQDLDRINPASGRDGAVRTRYAGLVDLPLVPVTGGTYTGTASTWSRSIAGERGVGFTVELGATLSDEQADRHADAVRTVASEMAAGLL